MYRPGVSESTRLMPKWFDQSALTHTLSSSISFPFNSASLKPFILAFHMLRAFLSSIFPCPFLAPPIQTYFFCFHYSSPLVFITNAHHYSQLLYHSYQQKYFLCKQQNKGVTWDTIKSILTFPKSLTSNKSNASKSSLFFIPKISQHAERKVLIFFKQRN